MVNNRKIKILATIILIIVVLFVTLLVANRGTIIKLVNINKANTIETKIEYEIEEREEGNYSILIKIENISGIQKITLSDGTIINCKGKTKLGIDRILKEGNLMHINVKTLEKEEEEKYVLVATKKPEMFIVDNPENDENTKTVHINYPNIENVKNYYSLDGGKTYIECNEEVFIDITNEHDLISKIEYVGEEKTINKPISYIQKYGEIEINTDTELWTNDGVIVSVKYPTNSESYLREISIDNGENYTEYTGEIKLEKNTTVKARMTPKNIGEAKTASKPIGNIDKLPPVFQDVNIKEIDDNVITISFTVEDSEATEEYGMSELKKDDKNRFTYTTTCKIKGEDKFIYTGTSSTYNLFEETAYDLIPENTYIITIEISDTAGNETIKTIEYTKQYTWDTYSVDDSAKKHELIVDTKQTVITKTYDRYSTAAVSQPSFDFSETKGFYRVKQSESNPILINYFPDYSEGSWKYYKCIRNDYGSLASSPFIVKWYGYLATDNVTIDYKRGKDYKGIVSSLNRNEYPDDEHIDNTWYVKK